MDVLFYVEPLIEREDPFWKRWWISHFVNKITHSLLKEGSKLNEIACIVPSSLFAFAKAELPNIRIESVDQTELVPKFGGSSLEIASKWYLDSAETYSLELMAKLVKSRLQLFEPTVCITFSPAPFIKVAYPDVSLLHMECGIVSRLPYPETVYFDPMGMFSKSVLARYSTHIKSWNPPAEGFNLLSEIRSRLHQEANSKNNPVRQIVKDSLLPFDSSVLLALQFSNFYAYDANADFKDQYDLLVHVLENLPKSIGVIVSEHPEHPVLQENVIQYLRQKYSNFIWHPIFRRLYSSSHYIMPFVDGVVTVTSSVGLQSLIWEKPLAVIGSGHLSAIADSHSIQDFSQILLRDKVDSKDNVLLWLLLNQHLPFQSLLNTGCISKYLKRLDDSGPEIFESAANEIGLDLDKIRAAFTTSWDSRSVSPMFREQDCNSRNFVACLYVENDLHGYDEQTSIRKFITFESSDETTVDFVIDGVNLYPKKIRLDIANCECVLHLKKLSLSDSDGNCLWELQTEDLNQIDSNGINIRIHDGYILLRCFNSDPHFNLPIPFSTLSYFNQPLVLTLSIKSIPEYYFYKNSNEIGFNRLYIEQIAVRDKKIDQLEEEAGEIGAFVDKQAQMLKEYEERASFSEAENKIMADRIAAIEELKFITLYINVGIFMKKLKQKVGKLLV